MINLDTLEMSGTYDLMKDGMVRVATASEVPLKVKLKALVELIDFSACTRGTRINITNVRIEFHDFIICHFWEYDELHNLLGVSDATSI
jgi:hypothetical protein